MPFFIDFIANLAAGWIGDLLTPYGMTGFAIAVAVTVAFAIYWHRQNRKAGKLGMASWPFIFACFAIAAIAIGGGAFGLGLRFATNENKGVAATSPPVSQNDNGPIDLYTGKRIAPQQPILDHKLNREEAQYLGFSERIIAPNFREPRIPGWSRSIRARCNRPISSNNVRRDERLSERLQCGCSNYKRRFGF